MQKILTFYDLAQLVERVLLTHGLHQNGAKILGETVAAAERDGSQSHGLARIEGYVSTLRSGWVNPSPSPRVMDVAPGLIVTDADNGFAQVALADSRRLLLEKAKQQGIAGLAIRNSHHYAALWPDIEPFAEKGLIALSTVNTRNYMVVWGSKKKVLGTNPMAFACPRKGHLPIVWDQASSAVSHGDILLAAKAGLDLPPGVGVDVNGAATTDPNALLEGGALLPFGGAKGAAIAFMVEILSAAVTGGRFGFDDRVAERPGGKTSNAGQLVVVVDPVQTAGEQFFDRVEEFVARLKASGVERLPGDRRHDLRRRANAEGIHIPMERYEAVVRLLG
jgi:delta1-piperideine-2-carboxylate reductase